ncbi:copper homeostasis membrane protein CopD [Phyllobacterium sp. 628]|uniref:copper homeostasis membrane protein CopD n=1 Tax=Phyllobacterium sp. 628 TaxID=2718938 RepID=UPI0016622131|nr:copper homeostasis membrane protein CopD [Phyllobacterium sp. 628]QND52849.1 copper homeostasis membrane protein CopD [Phyllobacterium sp. 628]
MNPEAALILCRFVHNVSALFLWGAFAYVTLLVPEDLAFDIGQRLQISRNIAIITAVLTTALALPLQAGLIGDGWIDAVDITTIRAVLLETSVGHGWLIQAIAALLLLPALLLPLRKAHKVTVAASGLLLAGLAFTGHATMQEGWTGFAHRINDIVHVLSGGAWLGALVPVMLVLRNLRQPELRDEAQSALMRFSRAGHIAVALVIASGLINTFLVLGRFPTDWSSSYQALLALKIILVAILVGLAIINRYVFVPRMRIHESSSVRAIAYGTIAEIALGFVVIGLVAWFGMLEPV